MKKMIATASAALLLGTTAHAQQSGLTEDEVRSFLQSITENAQDTVEGGDWQGLRNWAQQHLAEEATFAAKGVFLSVRGPVVSYEVNLDRQDLEQFGDKAMMGPQHMGGDAIQDYTLEGSIEHLSVLPNGEAAAVVQVHETATINPPQGGEGSEQQANMPAVTFQSDSRCDLRLGKEDDSVVIKIASCATTTTM